MFNLYRYGVWVASSGSIFIYSETSNPAQNMSNCELFDVEEKRGLVSSVSPSTSLGMCLSTNDASDECDVHHHALQSLDADQY